MSAPVQLMVAPGSGSRSAGALGPEAVAWVGAVVDCAAARLALAASTTLSPLNPNSANSLDPEALAP